MAVQERMVSSAGTDLDSLIHSLEYENQQYVKMIEKENQRNAYLASQEEEKLRAVEELQTGITSLEADTKKNHRQLVHNKNTLESLKKSRCVLQAHKDALVKHLDTLHLENAQQCHELQESVQMYQKTWKDYEAQYKSLALYRQLVQEEERLAWSQEEHSTWQHRKTTLQSKIRTAQDELDFREWHRFCVKIAEKRGRTGRKKQELLCAVREKETLQSKLKEIREKNTSTITTAASESAQDMETELSQSETWDKEEAGGAATDEELLLAAGDGGDTGGRGGGEEEGEKENRGTEQRSSEGTSTENVVQVFSDNQTINTNQNCDVRVPSVISLSSISPVTRSGGERMDEEGGGKRQVEALPRKAGGSTPSPSVTRRPLQPLQLTSTPKALYRPPPVLALPRIKMGLHHRPNPAPAVSGPQLVGMPRKAAAPAFKPLQYGAPHGRLQPPPPPPPPLPIPFISVHKPPPSPQIPTVRSAVSSILTTARHAFDKIPSTPSRIPLPRMPVLAPPPPSPVAVPSRFSRPVDKVAGRGVEGGEQGRKSSSVVGGSVPRMGVDQRQNGGEGMQTCVPFPQPDRSASGSPMLRASNQQGGGVRPSSESSGALTTTLLAPPQLTATSGAGDAPPLLPPEKVDPLSIKAKEAPKDSAKLASEDEDMESDTDSRDASQSLSNSQQSVDPLSQGRLSEGLSEGHLSEGHLSEGRLSQGHLSQGIAEPFSPFNLDLHKQKLMEIAEDSGDSFNFQQRHLFQTDDKPEDQSSHSNAAASSVFNMAFPSTPAVSKAQPMAPLFKDVASPGSSNNSSSSAAGLQQGTSHSERGGSFFSFEAMDTSEASPAGGLSLLSMFGGAGDGGDKEAEPFSFNFGAGSSSADDGNASGFSFSFGGGGDGGGKEENAGSVFSLF